MQLHLLRLIPLIPLEKSPLLHFLLLTFKAAVTEPAATTESQVGPQPSPALSIFAEELFLHQTLFFELISPPSPYSTNPYPLKPDERNLAPLALKMTLPSTPKEVSAEYSDSLLPAGDGGGN